MYSPRPPAPIAAAMVAEPTATTAATRTPATIDGSASGSSTWRNSSRDVIPMATPASRIDPSIREAGVAMGMTSRELLRQVELPLALPSIVAGVRVAAVVAGGLGANATGVRPRGLGGKNLRHL